ncbi:MAG: sigma-E processing peptidase SpoIIGA [Butyricicoccaceae bacterium]
MVVYLDVLFFTNVLMDWVTLLAAARLGGAKSDRERLALASLLGGVYAAGAALLLSSPLCPCACSQARRSALRRSAANGRLFGSAACIF